MHTTKLNCTHNKTAHKRTHTKTNLCAHTEQIHTHQKQNRTQNKTARAHTKQITHRHRHTTQNLHTTTNCAQIHTH